MNLIESFFEVLRLVLDVILDFLRFLFGVGSKNRQSKYHGKTMSFFTRFRLLNRFFRGIAIDGKRRISRANSLLHLAVIGGTGSFKSSLQWAAIMNNKRDSKFIIDVDGQGYKTTGGDQERMGVKTIVFDFSNLQKSAQVNFLDFVKDNSDGKKLAHKLVSSTYFPKTSSENIFWEYSATSLLALLINVTKQMNSQYHTLTNVRHLCQHFMDIKELMTQYCTQELWSEYIAIMSMDRKALAGVQASALVCLDKLSDPAIQHLTASSTFSYQEFIDKPVAVYFIIPESQIEYHSLFISIFIDSLFEYIQLHKPKKGKQIQMILDEVVQFSLPQLTKYCTVMRRYGTCITLIAQSHNQLIARFGEAQTRTILSGSCATKLILPGADFSLASELSQMFGRQGVYLNNEKGGYMTDREVLSPREIIQLKKGQALFIHRNESPYVIKKLYPFFKQRHLRRRSKIKPPVRESKPLEKPSLIPIPNSNNA